MKKKILIEGMSCKNCVAHVTEALEELNDAVKKEKTLLLYMFMKTDEIITI